jgi:hypothetical protein
MLRHRRAPAALAAAVALPLLLAACGSQDATQGSVRDDVKEALLDRPGNELSEEQAAEAADCVARGMFESGDFSPEDRNEVTRADDGDEPNPDLVAKVQALLDECVGGSAGGEG